MSWKVSNKHYPAALRINSCPALEISLDRTMDMTSAIGGKTPQLEYGGTVGSSQPHSSSFRNAWRAGVLPVTTSLSTHSGLYWALPLAIAH